MFSVLTLFLLHELNISQIIGFDVEDKEIEKEAHSHSTLYNKHDFSAVITFEERSSVIKGRKSR